MKRIHFLIIPAAVLLALLSCSSAGSDTNMDFAGSWEETGFDWVETWTFTENTFEWRFTDNEGTSTVSGNLDSDGDRLTMTPSGPEEQRTFTYEIDGDTLLLSEDGSLYGVYTRID